MARRIIKTAKNPLEIKVEDKSVFICACGLSKNQPYCDGSHQHTTDEIDGVIYEYDKDFDKTAAFYEDENEQGGCCGGGCCNNKSSCCGQSCDNKDCCNNNCGCEKEAVQDNKNIA